MTDSSQMTDTAEAIDRTERCWIFDTLAVTLARVDFLDPAMAETVDPRERGVRVEIRPVRIDAPGSIYSSPTIALAPAVCRIDLLESAPGKADRMHWHPVMADGEPGDREFVPEMVADPVGWLVQRLGEVETLLSRAGVADVERYRSAAEAIARTSAEIAEAARVGLDWARQAWPEAGRDERGMAVPV